MKLSLTVIPVFFISLCACSTVKDSKERQREESFEKIKFSCTATQGRQSVELPVLIKGGVPGKTYSQEPLRLPAKPFDILFSASDDGTSLQLTIQAATKFDQSVRATYWGPYPTEKMHVELSRLSAKISCF